MLHTFFSDRGTGSQGVATEVRVRGSNGSCGGVAGESGVWAQEVAT
jgi:hypothetical protein